MPRAIGELLHLTVGNRQLIDMKRLTLLLTHGEQDALAVVIGRQIKNLPFRGFIERNGLPC